MKYVGRFQPSPWGVIMSASRLDLFWKCPFFLSFSFSHSILLQYCWCQLVILMVFAASPKLKVSRIAIAKSMYGTLLLGIHRQGQMATKRLVGIDFQYQCRLHRFIFAVQSVIPRFLEMLNAILNSSLSRCVHVCARCLLVRACACVHARACVYAFAGEPPGCQDSSCLEREIVTFLSSENRTALWWVDRAVLVWCEIFQSQNWYTDSKSTWIYLYLLFFPLCHGFYFLFFLTTQTMFHSLSSHFSLHSNSSLDLIASFASFLYLSPSSPPSSISGLFNPPTTRCFHYAKGTSRYLHGRLVSLQ